jgi:hypothetical protein
MSDDSKKVPSQVFRWFERMKNNYEHNIQSVLQQFELFSANQQNRLDKSNDEHIANLKQLHQAQIELNKNNTDRLHAEIDFYKQQISSQQTTIEQLNQRYDTVLTCLFADNQKKLNIKDVYPEPRADHRVEQRVEQSTEQGQQQGSEQNAQQADAELINAPLQQTTTTDQPPAQSEQSNDLLFEQAMQMRQSGEVELAFESFNQLAQKGYAKAMGSLGRCYFIAEGIEQDHAMGLAWLIHAARLGLPQAISRVEQLQQTDPELYSEALALSTGLL